MTVLNVPSVRESISGWPPETSVLVKESLRFQENERSYLRLRSSRSGVENLPLWVSETPFSCVLFHTSLTISEGSAPLQSRTLVVLKRVVKDALLPALTVQRTEARARL